MIQGHGDDAYQYEDIRINFSSNIYSHADMSAMKEHLCRHISVIDSYPEPEPYSLERLIAEQQGIAADCVLVTNGATEAIYLIAQASAAPSFSTQHPTPISHFSLDGPSFAEYADACRLYGLSQRSSPRSSSHLAPRANQALWLCNPNNPTGRVYQQEEINQFLKTFPLVIIDQSYEHHTLEHIMSPADGIAYDNLIQIHSLTKTYAIPGLRIGYLTAQPHLIQQIRHFVRPWSVNALAIEAAHWLLTHEVKAVTNLPAYLREAQRLRDNLNSIPGINALPTETNFMLVRIDEPVVKKLKAYLAAHHGILIRDASNFNDLDAHYFRVAAQLPQENDLLVDAIRQFILHP